VSADLLDRRILGALRFVHGVTGAPLARTLVLRAPDVVWQRNHQGDYLIADAPGLPAHAATFMAPPDVPSPGSVSVTVNVTDPTGAFLPRRVQLRLPRDPDPARVDQPDSLFRAQAVELYPASAARADHDWARLHTSVHTASGEAERFVLLRVTRTSDNHLLARAMSDARGEALVAVAGIPVTPWEEADGPVLGNDLEVRIEAVFDHALTTLPDPDDLDARAAGLATVSVVTRIAAGRAQSLALQFAP
jgi:hypothetical protein